MHWNGIFVDKFLSFHSLLLLIHPSFAHPNFRRSISWRKHSQKTCSKHSFRAICQLSFSLYVHQFFKIFLRAKPSPLKSCFLNWLLWAVRSDLHFSDEIWWVDADVNGRCVDVTVKKKWDSERMTQCCRGFLPSAHQFNLSFCCLMCKIG